MKKYMVISPTWGEVHPILDDGTGPIEYGCDCLDPVEAESKRDAIIKASKHPDWHYAEMCRDDGVNPYSGVKAYEWCDCVSAEFIPEEDRGWMEAEGVTEDADPDCPKCHGDGLIGFDKHVTRYL